MFNEFYQITFRKKIYINLDELQKDADEWIRSYNEERPHSGKYCDGKTPMDTFLETKQKALDKIDMTAFLIWFAENYPESSAIMKKNPAYQNQFK